MLLLMPCSVQFPFCLAFLKTALCGSACFLNSILPCMWLAAFHSWHHVIPLIFKDNNPTGGFWLCHFFYIFCMIILSTIYVQECIYAQFLYVQVVLLWMWVSVCYWLLYVHYIIGWVYLICDVHLYECYVITDILMSLFMSYNITIVRSLGTSRGFSKPRGGFLHTNLCTFLSFICKYRRCFRKSLNRGIFAKSPYWGGFIHTYKQTFHYFPTDTVVALLSPHKETL